MKSTSSSHPVSDKGELMELLMVCYKFKDFSSELEVEIHSELEPQHILVRPRVVARETLVFAK